MKLQIRLVAVFLVAGCAGAAEVNPIQKVLELLSGLQAKVLADSEASQKAYEHFAEMCKDRSVDLRHSIKTSTAREEELKAVIEQATQEMEASMTKIEELSSTISADKKDLQEATDVRTKEESTFAAEEKEFESVIDTLNRAVGIVKAEMAKGSSFLQASTTSLTQALSALVDASSLNSQDVSTLTALVQASQDSSEDDELDQAADMFGAPSADSYQSHSSGLLETLEGLLDKAQTQMAQARQGETTQRHAYDLLKQSLEDKIENTEMDLDRAKSAKAAAEESKASNTKALATTQKSIEEDTQALDTLHHDCMSKASDFELETKSRGEEVKALTEAEKVIQETSSGAESISYGASAASLVQVHQQRTAAPAAIHALHMVRQLAQKRQSAVLSELVSRMEKSLRGKVSTADVFGKVKTLVAQLIDKLEEEGQADSSHKAFCDKAMAETKAKQDDKSADLEKATSRIDALTAKNMQLAKEITTVQRELNEIAEAQAQMDKIRQEEHAAFVESKADLEEGIKGIQRALKVLRDYYSKSEKDHDAGEGAGSSIIGLLEVCESDFTKGLSESEADEESAQSQYEEMTKDNSIVKASKEQDKAYKIKETKSIEKSNAEFTSDRASSQTELDAVNEYMAKLEEECVAKAEPYAERKRRREKEMASLKEVLEMLSVGGEGGAEAESFLQQGSKKQSLRGIQRHSMA